MTSVGTRWDSWGAYGQMSPEESLPQGTLGQMTRPKYLVGILVVENDETRTYSPVETKTGSG